MTYREARRWFSFLECVDALSRGYLTFGHVALDIRSSKVERAVTQEEIDDIKAASDNTMETNDG